MLIHKSKKLLVVVSIIFAVLLIASAIFYGFNSLINTEDSEDVVQPCSSEEYTDKYFGEELYKIENKQKHELFTEETKQIDQYEESPNCIYVVSNDFLNKYDAVNAEKYILLLEELLSSTDGYSGSFMDSTIIRSVDELKLSLDFVKKTNQTRDSGATNIYEIEPNEQQ